ncbi:MAG: hypothetical protein D4R73_02955 [Deltaproteobacteria bacterium]|nr:MAG: hypothetical protein D4R73_02955 [Deltaproteobacteria bacterium]
MADTLSVLVKLLLKGHQVKDQALADPRKDFELDWEQQFSPGTGAGLVDKEFDDERTLADGASENLDLSGGLTDSYGASIILAKVKILAIKNKSTTQTLSVGGAASLGFVGWVGDPTDIIKVGPASFALLICNPAGVAVTAGTGDLLKILNSAGAACIYDIFIAGSSA